MKEIAEKYLREIIKNAAIAVSTYFSDEQLQSAKDASTKSGLNIVRLLNKAKRGAIS